MLFSGLFEGHSGLWITDGTSAGTSELTVSGADPNGVVPSNFTVLGTKAVFEGLDAGFQRYLWVTDGTSGGTSELTVAGAYSFGLFDFSDVSTANLTPFGSKALLDGVDASGNIGLWVTDGTAAGTTS